MTILDRFRIDDRVAIVTGASSGLGVALAAALAEAGADVSLGARRQTQGDGPSLCGPTWPIPTTVVGSLTPPCAPSAGSTYWSTTLASAPRYQLPGKLPSNFDPSSMST